MPPGIKQSITSFSEMGPAWSHILLCLFPSSSTGKRTHLQCRRSWFDSCVRKFSRRRHRLPTPVSLSFPDGSDSKESACNVGDLGSTPGMEKSPGGGHGNPLQYSCLENPQGQRSLVGYGPRGCKESDTTERLCTLEKIIPTNLLSWLFR